MKWPMRKQGRLIAWPVVIDAPNGANCNALLLQLSLVMLLCMHVIIPFAYGKIKTIESVVTIWSTAGQIAYRLNDRPKPKIAITPL